MRLICPFCGFSENPTSAKFCGKCGGKISMAQEEPEKSKSILDNTGTFKKSLSISRNDPCPCGSGKRYKNCHGKQFDRKAQ